MNFETKYILISLFGFLMIITCLLMCIFVSQINIVAFSILVPILFFIGMLLCIISSFKIYSQIEIS